MITFNIAQNVRNHLNILRLILKFSDISKTIINLFYCCLYKDLIMLHIAKCITNASFWLKRNFVDANAEIWQYRCESFAE